MVVRNLSGGGNILRAQPIIVRRSAAIGDAIAATVVTDKLIDLGFDVQFQTHIAIHCVLRRHPRISGVSEPNGFCHINLDGAYEKDPNRRRKHFYQMFLESANLQLNARGLSLGPMVNCRPQLFTSVAMKEALRAKFKHYPKPWVFFNPRSETYNVRQVPDAIWSAAAKQVKGTVFWLGIHPGPPNIIDLQCRHLDNVINYLSVADLLVSVDTGPLHIAAALNTPVIGLGQSSSPELHLGDQSDFLTIEPKLECLNCQENICRLSQYEPPCQKFDPGFVADWVNAKLNIYKGRISAVVPVYKPDVNVLNRCLSALLDQVDEIIVPAEAQSVVPSGALKHEKIRYVRTTRSGIGYSGNANFGARNSTGEYILFINDDCFLNPGAVKAMMEVNAPDVAIVSNLLFYPDGTIYHAGKIRVTGERGWRHIDYRKQNPTFQGPVELENCCGCCVLVRRKVFYDVGGYDEEMPIFAQDDAFALAVRKAGYRIMFTPHSTGIHMEHQSLSKLPDSIPSLLSKANAAFTRKWGRYFDHNASRIPGNFAYAQT